MLGDKDKFATKHLTLEFKNNLDGLIAELSGDSRKSYANIDICVCWGVVDSKFDGYTLTEVMESNIDERAFPGVTHILYRDGDAHTIQVIMLRDVLGMIRSGQVHLTP